MGFLDKLKGKGGLTDKAVDLAKKHDDKIDRGIDKAADLADKRTKGMHTDTSASHRTTCGGVRFTVCVGIPVVASLDPATRCRRGVEGDDDAGLATA